MSALTVSRLAAACLVLALSCLTNWVHAADAQKEQAALLHALDAVERGAFNEAVDELELLADQGFVHPDASRARAYAYVERARSRAAEPGDLGRAVAALEEARLLDPDDSSSDEALEKVRAEIARRRARESDPELLQRPALGRAVVALIPENAWAVLSASGSLLLTLGLTLRSFVRRRSAEIAGSVGIVSGILIGALCGVLAATARHYRTSTRPAVVVAPEARWLDESGRPITRPGRQPNVVPEGALVHVRGERNGRYEVEWGSLEGWLSSAQLRILVIGRPNSP